MSQQIQRIYKDRPNTTKLDLSFSQIDEIESIMGDLYKFKNLDNLILSANRMSFLPDDLSILKNVKTLDIKHNAFVDKEKLFKALKTMPKLRELKVSLSESEEQSFGKLLPDLEYLNDKQIKSAGPRVICGQNFLGEAFKKKTDRMKQERETRTKFFGKNMIFGESDMTELVKVLEKIGEDQKIGLNSNFLDNKSNCQDKLTKIMKAFRDSAVKNSNKENKKANDNSGSADYNKEVMTSRCDMADLLFDPIVDAAKLHSPHLAEGLKSFFDVLRRVSDNYVDYLKVANDPANWALGNQQYVNITSNSFGKGHEKLLENYGMDKEQLLIKQSELNQEIANLKAENEKVYSHVIKLSKNEANSNQYESEVVAKRFESNFRTNDSMKFLSVKEGDVTVSQKRIRVLTMNQLKETIHDIMVSKKANDKKNDELDLPRETTEQHMYTYLSKKYGLKSLVIEWATSIVDSIKNYQNQDSIVCLFAKFLKNECDEEFYWVQQNVKVTMKDLMITYFKVKSPQTQIDELKKKVDEILKGTITRGECHDLIKHIYATNDQKVVSAELDLFCAKDNLSLTYGKDYKLRFRDYEDIILKYQLKTHEEFLAGFIKYFGKFDDDNDGIINYEDCYKLLEDMRVGKVKLDSKKILETVDPKMTGFITFSGLCEKLNHTLEENNLVAKTVLQALASL